MIGRQYQTDFIKTFFKENVFSPVLHVGYVLLVIHGYVENLCCLVKLQKLIYSCFGIKNVFVCLLCLCSTLLSMVPYNLKETFEIVIRCSSIYLQNQLK